MKREKSIKEGGSTENGESRNLGKNTIAIRKQTCNQTVCRPISMLWALGYLVNLQRKNYAILTHSHTHKPGKNKKKKRKKEKEVILQIA